MKLLIKQMRQYRNMTLDNLSKVSGVSKSALQRIESGAVSPTLDQMEAIANALEIKIECLMIPDYTFNLQ